MKLRGRELSCSLENVLCWCRYRYILKKNTINKSILFSCCNIQCEILPAVMLKLVALVDLILRSRGVEREGDPSRKAWVSWVISAMCPRSHHFLHVCRTFCSSEFWYKPASLLKLVYIILKRVEVLISVGSKMQNYYLSCPSVPSVDTVLLRNQVSYIRRLCYINKGPQSVCLHKDL